MGDETKTVIPPLQAKLRVVLVLCALAFTVASFFLPWWGVGTIHGFQPLHKWISFGPSGWHYGGETYALHDAGMWGPISELMGFVAVGLISAVVLEAILLVVILSGRRIESLIFGSWLAIVLLVTVVGFAAEIALAFRESSGDTILFRWWQLSQHPDSFAGTRAYIPPRMGWIPARLSYQVDVLWSPLGGWIAASIAAGLAAAATFISAADSRNRGPTSPDHPIAANGKMMRE